MQTAFEHICVYMKMYVYKNVNEHVYEYKDIYYIYIYTNYSILVKLLTPNNDKYAIVHFGP